jgi:hypothetical protein
LKIGGRCPYFLNLQKVTKGNESNNFIAMWWILSMLLGDYLMGIHIQVGLLWCGWCDYISRFKDRGDNVAHWKTCPTYH